MFKKSKGKHGNPKPKAAVKFEMRGSDAKSGGGHASSCAGSHAPSTSASAAPAPVAVPFASGSSAEDSAAPCAPAALLDAMQSVQALQDEGAAADVTAAMPVSVGGQSAQPGPDAFVPASIELEKDPEHRKRLARRVAIAAFAVVLVLAGAYLAGVAYFSTHFMPCTYISNIDVSLATPEEVRAEIADTVEGYSIRVRGHGLNVVFSAEDAGLDVDADNMTETMTAAQDPWRWPVEVFGERDMTGALTDALSATKLSEVVDAAVAGVNQTAIAPENAKVEYDAASEEFVVVSEVEGTQLDADKVLEEILVKMMSLEGDVMVTDELLIQPTVLKDDPLVLAAVEEANSLIKANITLMLGSNEAGTVTSESISEWVSISPEYVVSFNEDALSQWASELASKFNTVGSTRTYTRADGKSVTVKGGDYGWSIDSSTLISSVEEGVKSGMIGTLDIPVLQSGKAYSAATGKDWGNRYIDVDISEQHARFYGDDGTIIWESDIVSGTPNSDRATPTGVFDLNTKGKNIKLVGRDSDGNVTYETPVAYWMAFKGNSVGFHDATWQSSFGGSRYKTSGSHGCVNLPYSKAEALYGLISVGDVVVVHY